VSKLIERLMELSAAIEEGEPIEVEDAALIDAAIEIVRQAPVRDQNAAIRAMRRQRSGIGCGRMLIIASPPPLLGRNEG
jgi:hypothetical protein